ncbi:MAG: acyl carrier protein [Alphaproteobacteria bacterium]|uniref:Acyl carrier protein n=1 Tax=Candidatus Nitrobium versatile TaxID=2884831 RepID=A0A953J6S5_9BACT|nr:acyl carrier protein [Candidatus Nitrobium versatile]
MAVITTQEIEKTLAGIAEDLIQDWGLEREEGISGSTKLVADLEFASVDVIQFCVAIEQHYRQKMGFQDLLMKEGSYVPDLSIAQIAEFLAGKIKRED